MYILLDPGEEIGVGLRFITETDSDNEGAAIPKTLT